jgi:hypothetical protein
VGDESHVTLGQEFPGEKGSVKWFFVVMQQKVLMSPKVGAVFTNFHAVCRITHRSLRTNSLRTIPLMSKKVMSMLLILLFASLAFSGLSEFGLFYLNTHAHLMLASLNARVSATRFVRSAQN